MGERRLSEAVNDDDTSVTVVTGLSGAGKTTVLAALADLGFYVVDNLPPALAATTVDTLFAGGISRVALGVDIRVGAFLDDLADVIERLRQGPHEVEVLYLDAADDVVVRRFSETRRPHPMIARHDTLTLAEAVQRERERLLPMRDAAQLVVDTSHLNVHEVRRTIIERYSERDAAPRMQLKVMSFGFKHGVPLDVDVMFDVRFLDNPHFVPGLREQTGMDAEVRDFVLASPGARMLVDKLEDLLVFAIPRYRQEGKSYLTVGIGCTGGRHRSVALTVELARRLSASAGEAVGIVHRDVRRGAMMSEVTATRNSGEGGGGD
jgi:RNase adapter protein RapZ